MSQDEGPEGDVGQWENEIIKQQEQEEPKKDYVVFFVFTTHNRNPQKFHFLMQWSWRRWW